MKQKNILKKIKHRYLLIGGANTGKTSLLLASNLDFLVKAANVYGHPQPESWWMTDKAAFLDVPGRYLGNQLLKKRRPQVTGLIITVSIPELLRHHQTDYHQLALDKLYQRLTELPRYISDTLPCYVIVTQCDLLPGFIEFFSESSSEELNQVWGMSAFSAEQDDLNQAFSKQFNQLLSVLNQQLIWRLHQSDVMKHRAEIKDFPLEMEKIKAPLFSFVKNCMASSSLVLRGIYFTSALQKEVSVIQPYFIKKLFDQEFNRPVISAKSSLPLVIGGVLLSLTIGMAAAWGLNKNVRQNLHEIDSVQKIFLAYQQSIKQTVSIQARLEALVTLLNYLEQYQLSKYNINQFYERGLQNLLLPEIKNYLENYLRDPINKNRDFLYAALTSYLMLGNKDTLQSAYFLDTIYTILPNKMADAKKLTLIHHLELALSRHQTNLILDKNLITASRNFLSSLTGFQLGYLILKNMNIEKIFIEKYLNQIDPKHSVFEVIPNQTVPQIYTGPLFSTLFSRATKRAAEQAIVGNWILGDDFKTNTNPEIIEGLAQQLQTIYVSHYVEKWKSLLSYFKLKNINNLSEMDEFITHLIGPASPLLAFLKFFHDNTAFAPIRSNESPFESLNALIVEGEKSPVLAEIFSTLYSLHRTLQNRLHNELDILAKLRLAANKSPIPIKNWMLDIANETERLLLEEGKPDVKNRKNNLSRR